MSTLKPPPRMKIFLAAYSGDPALTDLAVGDLFREFMGGALGAPDLSSPDMPMPGEAYYAREMGPGLRKRYLSSPARLEPGALVDLKLLAMEIEGRRLGGGGGRMVNLDPGYVSLGGLVLATGKFTGHRLWLGRGVWGELTLLYGNGGWITLPWTYRDYADPEVQRHLSAMRALLLRAEGEDRAAGEPAGRPGPGSDGPRPGRGSDGPRPGRGCPGPGRECPGPVRECPAGGGDTSGGDDR